MQVRDWYRENKPEEKMVYALAANHQVSWVCGSFAYMVWNSLLGKDALYEDRLASLTVDGTHRSKSILLPVYRFDCNGVTIKIRDNFHDWCLRCNKPMKVPFPSWMQSFIGEGYFEGMENENSPTKFCVQSQEQLYACVWWMLNEAIDRE